MPNGREHSDSQPWIPDHENLELVVGLVAPVGTKLDTIVNVLEEHLTIARYKAKQIHIASTVIPSVVEVNPSSGTPFDIAMRKMDAGNTARCRSGDNAILALGAATVIFGSRHNEGKGGQPLGRVAHIIRSIKHPEEVERLREIYPQGFYLIGVNADEDRRLRFLVDERRMSEDEARQLMERDEDEHLSYGQQLSSAFHMADFFVRLDENADRLAGKIKRIVELIMGYPYHTPTFDEYSMFLAFAASLRSADLSRQVGAVVADEEHREVLSTGTNDCPRRGGGLYWPCEVDGIIGDEDAGRDYMRGRDPNFAERQELIERIGGQAVTYNLPQDELRNLLQKSDLRHITEYGRVVHAEMEAILSCTRIGVSTRGMTLYGTTFPCHNCAKHIVAAGIRRVVYVEPYAKSKAEKLHDDSICVNKKKTAERCSEPSKVSFEAFEGVGPRRFFDLFSMRVGSGRYLQRKNSEGQVLEWQLEEGVPRRQMLPYSYLDLETAAASHFLNFQTGVENKDGQPEEEEAGG